MNQGQSIKARWVTQRTFKYLKQPNRVKNALLFFFLLSETWHNWHSLTTVPDIFGHNVFQRERNTSFVLGIKL